MQHSRGRRFGSNFTLRIPDHDRARLEALQAVSGGPRALGPWLVWSALSSGSAGAAVGALPGPGSAAAVAVPGQVGHCRPGRALPELVPRLGSAAPARQCHDVDEALPAPAGGGGRVVLDLCGGSGAWSRPYTAAGYDVRLVTLPACDVRDFRPPTEVWGVLAAPPCTEFSIASRKPEGERDLLGALEIVCACLRIVAECRPHWWALENPGSGLLRRWLGTPRDVWQPSDFGDPHTKLTAIWGHFAVPARSHVRPTSRMVGKNAAERAVTPAGFARAFFAANP